MFQDAGNREFRPSANVASLTAKGEPAIADWLRSIGAKVQMRDGHIATLSLRSTLITDRELEVLANLPQLEEVNLRDTEISEIGIAHLSSVRSLRNLDLGFTLLSDSALSHLASLA